jgi:hypothetical protein
MSWALIRQLVAVALLGALAGGVTGLLGRLAMRVLALTSPPIAQGRLTDDLARVGEFTLSGTIVLVLFCAVVGAVVALTYPLVRRLLPARSRVRVLGFAILTGSVGGAILVHDHPSFDYTILQPTWLAVALFICVPAAYGAMTAALIERTVSPGCVIVQAAPRHRAVVLLGRAICILIVFWGCYNLVTDIISLAMDTPASAPMTL